MYIIDGGFTTHCLFNIFSPKVIDFNYKNKIRIKISQKYNHYPFRVYSKNKIKNSSFFIDSLLLSISYLLDFELKMAYSSEPFKVSNNNILLNKNKKIIFQYSEKSWDFINRGKLTNSIERLTNHKKIINISDIIILLDIIYNNETLYYSMSEYFKAKEEPEFFSHCIYKSYESIKKHFHNEKTFKNTLSLVDSDFKKMTKILNDDSFLNSRHANSNVSNKGYINTEEYNICFNSIKSIIEKFILYLKKN